MKTAAELKRDVLEELAWEKSLDAAAIGVAVAEGAVTLTGHVCSYADRRTAEKAVKRVRGVIAVANELEVQLPGSLEMDDTDIAQTAATALAWNVSVPDTVTATVERGWITLSGEVQWPYQRRAAENALRYLAGMRGLSNLIVVRARPAPKDVKEQIRAAFQRSAQIDADQVDVSVAGGRVTLTGTVRSWSERTEAEHAARTAAGVTEVENRLGVAGLSTVLV